MNRYGYMLDVLTAIFVTLKLAGLVDWSWWFVFSPIWFPIIALGVIWVVLGSLKWLLTR